MKEILAQFRASVIATISLAVLLCGIYPLAVWVLAQGLFPDKANGSLIPLKGSTAGSSLIAQSFTDPKYFHPRPSAAGYGYDAASSGRQQSGADLQEDWWIRSGSACWTTGGKTVSMPPP